MAAETVSKVSAQVPPPHYVGGEFIEQYYRMLHKNPEAMHHFYVEDSVLGRPNPEGEMQSVKSKEAIREHILSSNMNYSEVDVMRVDCQGSLNNGVLVLVTGYLTGGDTLKRKFAQTFVLAPADDRFMRYNVMNDIFRYFDEELHTSVANDVDESTSAALLTPDVNDVAIETTEQVEPPVSAVENHSAETQTEGAENVKEGTACNGKVSPSVTDAVGTESSANQDSEEPPSEAPLDAGKKSFVSIVQSMAKNAAPFHLRVSPAKPKRVEQPTVVPKAPEQVPAVDALPEKIADPAGANSADGASIFVANLPMNATPAQLHETFKEFGSIKPDGIQVRSYKLRGNCFGFVAFESTDSVKSVLQAAQSTPIKIGDLRVSIEEKRANNESSKPSSRNGRFRNDNGFRNDGFRGQRSFNGSRNYSRNRYEKRGDSQNGDSNQQIFQNGGRRVPRQVYAGN